MTWLDWGCARARELQPAARLFALAGVVALDTSCRDQSIAIQAANDVRTVGHAMAVQLDTECTKQYERAATLAPAEAGAEALRLDRKGCPRFARAHDVLRASHKSLVAVIAAIDAGQCDSFVNQPPRECDLVGAIANVIDASAELARAAERVKE
jgi:hypothetical protein